MITLKKKFTDITNFVFKKKVIVRVDLNLPFFEDKVSDYTRLEKIIPTIDFLLKNNSKIILISHFVDIAKQQLFLLERNNYMWHLS